MKRADMKGKEGRRKICHFYSQVEDGLKRHDNHRGGNKHERELTHISEIELMFDNVFFIPAMQG